jgi:rod shape-determining protein MreC
MESFFSRYKNPLILVAVLFVQVIALATQIKRPLNPHAPNSGSTSLARKWAATAFAPVEKGLTGTENFFSRTWRNYIDLHNVRKENRDLQAKVDQLKIEQAQLRMQAEQTSRLQALLGFKQRFVGETLAAQVISASGSEQSRVVYIDRGSSDGLKPNMAVITPDGIVGKVKEVYRLSSQVLLINDHESGAGVVLEKARLQGVLKGFGQGETQVTDIMSDEKVQAGESVVTSGGDGIYPKGLPVGMVTSAASDRESEPFLRIKVKLAANLNQLEEVLVVTKVAEQTPSVAEDPNAARAADVLARRLPTVTRSQDKPPDKTAGTTPGGQKKPAVPAQKPVARPPAENAEKPPQ